jgi:DNA-binding transcriptional LysR family regulator
MVKRKCIAVVVVALHTALLACYTFPSAFIPEKLRVLGQLYARPVFHQQWRLFAPDPPRCACRIESRWGARTWITLDHRQTNFLERRTAQAIARHIQAGVHEGDTMVSAVLLPAMRSMALYSEYEPGVGRPLPSMEFRLVEHCVTDAEHPRLREERITQLRMP